MFVPSLRDCAFAVLTTVAVAHAQPHQAANPFVDRADTGELIHVLPTPASIHSPRDTQATDAPVANGTAVYPASYGSGKLQYHGGRIMSSASYYAVYWNASVAMAVQDRIQAFVTNFADNHNFDNSPTDDYEIIQQYGGSNGFPANTLPFLGTFVDSKPAQSTIKDSAIRNYLSSPGYDLRHLLPFGHEGHSHWRYLLQQFLWLSQPLHLQWQTDQVRRLPVSGLLGLLVKRQIGCGYADHHQQP